MALAGDRQTKSRGERGTLPGSNLGTASMGIEGDTRRSFLCREHGQFTAMGMGFLGLEAMKSKEVQP